MYSKFWFDGDSFVWNLDASVELRQHQSLSQKKFFLFLTECYFFFLLWAFFFFFYFFTKDFLPLLIFPGAKIFKFPWAKSFYVWIFSSGEVNKKIKKPQDERLPQNFPQAIRSVMTPSWFIKFIWKYVFLNNLGAFKDLRNFFMETFGQNVRIQFS